MVKLFEMDEYVRRLERKKSCVCVVSMDHSSVNSSCFSVILVSYHDRN